MAPVPTTVPAASNILASSPARPLVAQSPARPLAASTQPSQMGKLTVKIIRGRNWKVSKERTLVGGGSYRRRKAIRNQWQKEIKKLRVDKTFLSRSPRGVRFSSYRVLLDLSNLTCWLFSSFLRVFYYDIRAQNFYKWQTHTLFSKLWTNEGRA